MKRSNLAYLMILGMLSVSMAAEAALIHLRWQSDSPRALKKFEERIQEIRRLTGATIYLQQFVTRSLSLVAYVTLEGEIGKFSGVPETLLGENYRFDDRLGDTYTLEILLTTTVRKLLVTKDHFPDRFVKKFATLEDLRTFIEQWKMYPIDNGVRFPLANWIEFRKFRPDPRQTLLPHYLIGLYVHSRGKTYNLLVKRDDMEEFYDDPQATWRVICPNSSLGNPAIN